jgi:S-adenosylmethionine hydrolase
MANPIITLTTDFGEGSRYVAAMKGVILSIHPQARIVGSGSRASQRPRRCASHARR